MIILSILLAASCQFSARTTPNTPDDLYIEVKSVRSERITRDQNWLTTTWTVSGNKLTYKRTLSGAHGEEVKPFEKQQLLSSEDQANLARLLNEQNLLVTKEISKPLGEGRRSFYLLDVSIQSKLNGNQGSISIHGSQRDTAIKNDPSYQKLLRLIETLYSIAEIRGDRLPEFEGFADDELENAPQQSPPRPTPTPVEDTARYAEWMKSHGTPITDQPHEDVSLRIGDWGFFYHGDRPVGSWTPLRDRVALDRSGRAVTGAESSDWFAFLNTPGLDASGALKRIGWLLNAGLVNPATEPKGNPGKITAPVLILSKDAVSFQGWLQANSDPPYRQRLTIATTPAHTKLTLEKPPK